MAPRDPQPLGCARSERQTDEASQRPYEDKNCFFWVLTLTDRFSILYYVYDTVSFDINFMATENAKAAELTGRKQ